MMVMVSSLSGKVAFITGGASGIGAALAPKVPGPLVADHLYASRASHTQAKL